MERWMDEWRGCWKSIGWNKLSIGYIRSYLVRDLREMQVYGLYFSVRPRSVVWKGKKTGRETNTEWVNGTSSFLHPCELFLLFFSFCNFFFFFFAFLFPLSLSLSPPPLSLFLSLSLSLFLSLGWYKQKKVAWSAPSSCERGFMSWWT